MIKNMVCMVAGHRIDRRKVRYNGLTFTCRCQRCNTQLERESTGWAPASHAA